MSDTPSGGRRPLGEFVDTEVLGGVLLVVAAIVAFGWANSPWASAYERLWTGELPHELGPVHFPPTLKDWVADGLMAVYFFVAGMEIKRELTVGELRDRRQAAFPVAGALGGMLVPALIYAAINRSGDAAVGWGIPMATDIAFALAILALVGRRLPDSARIFLLSLAVVDDIGAILVIALFYGDGVKPFWLLVAALLAVAVYATLQVRGTQLGLAAVAGAGMWLAMYEAGIHPTIAGVLAGLMVPSSVPANSVALLPTRKDETQSVLDRLTHLVHPWSSFAVAPLFALSAAGVAVTGTGLRSALTDPVAIGVLVGLVVGKPLGIYAGCRLVTLLGLATRPDELQWATILGIGVIGGIGFTVSLLVASLAFDDPAMETVARLAVLAAAVVAIGLAVPTFLLGGRRRDRIAAAGAG